MENLVGTLKEGLDIFANTLYVFPIIELEPVIPELQITKLARERRFADCLQIVLYIKEIITVATITSK